MKPYTYLIKHKSTGKVYYGVRTANTKEPADDLWVDYFTSSLKIKKLIKEYGKDSFEAEVRQIFESKEQAIKWEPKVLRRCKVLERQHTWLNGNVAGYILATPESCEKISNSLRGKPKSDEHKRKISAYQKGKMVSAETSKKISEANKGKPAPNKGKPASNETRKKISDAKKGKSLSEETRKKISDAKKGKSLSEETRKKISDTKKSISDVTRTKMSTAKKGKPKSEEHKKQLSKINKGKTWIVLNGKRVWTNK